LEGKDTRHPVAGVSAEKFASRIEDDVVLGRPLREVKSYAPSVRVDGAGKVIVLTKEAEENHNSSFKWHLASPKGTRRGVVGLGALPPGGPQ